jgi:hypothetical protein
MPNRDVPKTPEERELFLQAIDKEIQRREAQEQQPGIFERAGKFISGEGQRRPGVPDFHPNFGETGSVLKDLGVGAGTAFSADPEQLKDIAVKQYGAEIIQDEYGNDMIRIPGRTAQPEETYVNRPGLSSRDITNVTAQGGLMMAPMAAIGQFTKTILPRLITTAMTEFMASIGIDKASEMAGSEQGVSLPRAAVAGAAGAAGELVAPILNPLWRKGSGAVLSVWNKVNGVPPNAARQVLADELGVATEEITEDVLRQFDDMVRATESPEAAARLANAETMDPQVPLTRGMVSKNVPDVQLEDAMKRNAYGPRANQVIKDREASIDKALRGNVDRISGEINPYGQVERNQSGQMVQQKLDNQYQGLKQTVGDAYDAARNMPGSTQTLPNDVASVLADEIKRGLDEFGPFTEKADQLFAGFWKKAQRPDGISIQEIFNFRRQASQIANSASDKTEAAALRGMVRQVDELTDDFVAQGLMGGDEVAITAWKKAIKLRRAQGKIFESKRADDLVSRLVEKKEGTFKVQPEAASNFIFGASDTGLYNKPQLAAGLRKIKALVGEDGEQWAALKQEAFLRIMRRATEGSKFSGAKLKTDLNKIIGKNAEVWNELFDNKERAAINRFAKVSEDATVFDEDALNRSGTSAGLISAIRNMMSMSLFGPKAYAILSAVIPDRMAAIQGLRASSGINQVLQRARIPVGMGGAAVGATARTNTDQNGRIQPPELTR